jgi:hypothetical protein
MRIRRALSLAAGELDQVPRLRAIRAQYPHVVIGTLGVDGAWQARIPRQDGETILTRYQLKELLDRLAEVLGEQDPDQAGTGPDQPAERENG